MKQNHIEILLSSFRISNFSYCSLISMFCSEKITKRINAVDERSNPWLYVIMSRTRFRVNLHFIVAWISKTICSKQKWYLKFKWLQRVRTHKQLFVNSSVHSTISQTGHCHCLLLIISEGTLNNVSPTTYKFSYDRSLQLPEWTFTWHYIFKLRENMYNPRNFFQTENSRSLK